MGDGSQLESLSVHFEAPALDGLDVKVERFELSERLDEPFVLDVEIAIDAPDVEVGALLGHDATLVLARGSIERRVCGLVRTVWEGEAPLGATRARLHVVPALWMLSLHRDTRIFQEKTAPEILEAVLGDALAEHGRSVRLELRESYPRREYCLQYQESHLELAQRLMEEEGISYAFDHTGEVEEMVLRDSNDACVRVESATDTIELQPTELQARDREVVHHFDRRHAHTSTSVVVRDWDWTTPGFLVEDEARAEDALGRDRESYEHGHARTLRLWDYDQAARRYQQRDTPRQKAVRQQAHQAAGLVGEGTGRVIGFAPGRTFELVGHPTPGVDGEYLITSVRHVSEAAPESRGADGQAERYHNSFECIPLEIPHRPARRARKPRIPSVQTATVVGPAGEEIHTDEHGRIKVQFPWDRESPADETASCWVRCEQAWAGAGWGFWWLPRIGMEVVVHFADGDPDRPLVSGCVYNGANPPPYPLPDEKTKSTIKSNSSPGGGGFNELRFEDKAGSEEIYTHAQKDYNEVVENDHTTHVRHDQVVTVDNDQIQVIGNDQTEAVHGNQSLSVGGNRTVHVMGTFDEQVDGTETRTVHGDVSETFDANETRSIGASVTEDIGGNETRSIGAAQTEDIGASHALTIAGSSTKTIGGSLTESVDAGITTTTPAAYSITAVGGFNVTAAAGITMSADAGIKIIAPGGVRWIDSSDNWFGAALIETTPAKISDFTALDLTLGGMQIGASGAKWEVAAMELSNAGKGTPFIGAKMVARGAKTAGGALRKLRGFRMRGS